MASPPNQRSGVQPIQWIKIFAGLHNPSELPWGGTTEKHI